MTYLAGKWSQNSNDDPSSNKNLTALNVLARGIEAGAHMSGVYPARIKRDNSEFISWAKGRIPDTDLIGAVSDPENREGNLAVISDRMLKAGATPKDMEMFAKFSENVAEFTSIEGTYSGLQKEVYDSVARIKELEGSLDPEAVKEKETLLFSLQGKADKVRAFTASGYQDMRMAEESRNRIVKERKDMLDEQKRVLDMDNSERNQDRNDAKLLILEGAVKTRNNKEVMDYAAKIIKDKSYEAFGLQEGDDIDSIISAIYEAKSKARSGAGSGDEY